MNFYKDVENYFLELRGRLFGLSSYNLLSPKEIQAIKKWESARIPLKAIYEGIEDALIRFLRNYPHRRDDPPSLLYCQPTVLKHFRNLKEAAAGEKPSAKYIESKKDKTSELIAKTIEDNIKIISALGKQAGQNPDHTSALENVKEFTLSRLDKLRHKEMQSEFEIEDGLESIKNELLKVLHGILGYTEFKKYIIEIRNEINEYKYKMTKKGYRDIRNSLFEDRLLEMFGISGFKTKI